MQAPCKDCPDRKLGCHSICEKYIAYDKHRKELSAKRAELNQIVGDVVYASRKRRKR